MKSDGDLRVERRIAAQPADVYAYLTDSVLWARWQGASAEIEAVPGGVFRMAMADGSVAEGNFIELIPDRRVVFTWGWRGSPTVPPGSSTVEMELVPDGDGTVLRLTHRGLPPEDRSVHSIGWVVTCRASRRLPRVTTSVLRHDLWHSHGPAAHRG